MNANLESAKTLENFIMNLRHLRRDGTPLGRMYEREEKVLVYYNAGYEAHYSMPDWEKMRNEIVAHYRWVETDDQLQEAFSDAIHANYLWSRG